MKVRVEGTYGSHFRFRITLPDGRRFSLRGMDWTRKMAREALDTIQLIMDVRRRNIRFEHS